jgi:hypothetical protein
LGRPAAAAAHTTTLRCARGACCHAARLRGVAAAMLRASCCIEGARVGRRRRDAVCGSCVRMPLLCMDHAFSACGAARARQ